MKTLLSASIALIASVAPALSYDGYDAWDEPGSYVVERRVTVETYVRPSYPLRERRAYAVHPAEVYDDVPYVEYAPPRSRYVVVDDDDRECTVKRRWHHGRLVEKIRCD